MSLSLAARTRWIVGLALCGSAAAMLRYPGGTPLDATTSGYALSENFLSDLGMTVAYDHQPNRVGATLFACSLLLLVGGLGNAVGHMARRLVVAPLARRWAFAAAVFATFACVAFIGVAATPENTAMPAHIQFTLWAWRSMPFVAGSLAAASFRAPGFGLRSGSIWLGASLLLAAYAVFLSWGPSLAATHGLVAQVVAQKVATVVTLAAVLFGAEDVSRAPPA